MGRSSKGSGFERNISRRLSSWWSSGERDDIFWRIKSSGARATTRAKKGKKTYGQHGDIGAYDPCGVPLVKLFSIELKRGYAKWCVTDVLDSYASEKLILVNKFVKQAQRQAREAGVPYFLLVMQRDRHRPLAFTDCPLPVLVRLFNLKSCNKIRIKGPGYTLMGFCLEDLLGAHPADPFTLEEG
jgi:hypothetical protein